MLTRRSARQATRRENLDLVEPETQDAKRGLKTKLKKETAISKRVKFEQKPSQSPSESKSAFNHNIENTKQVRKRIKYDCISFKSDGIDPIIESLRESSKELDIFLDDELLIQIALEGLSGITFGRLLRILDAIFPNLGGSTNRDSQRHVWSIIVGRYMNYPPGANVRAFYQNPKLQKNDTSQDIDSQPVKGVVVDKPIKLPAQTLERMARKSSSLHPIQVGPIMGSCANYLTRVDITDELLKMFSETDASSSMHLAHSKYDLDNISFVAAQEVRSRALLPEWVDPSIDIKLREYCALEFIGKSRTLGAVFPNDKTLGRYRLMLLAKDFISQYQQNNSCPIIHHLKRFAREKLLAIQSSSGLSKALICKQNDKNDENPEQTITELCCDPSKMKPDRCTLAMVYDTIAQTMDGITQIDIRRKLHMPKFHLRNHLKNLLSLKMICSYANKDPENPFRVYKPAHKSRRKLKAIDSKEALKGIMANWDEADLRAKRIIGHKRSSFSQAEDSLLILCRITSILIDPKCRLSWCVNKRLIRDLLHNELVESHDKTSDACLRRIKYLKRLPNNIMSINELTAELQDDPDIRDIVDDKKSTDNDHKLNKLFTQVLNTVRAKIPNLLGITSATQTTFGHQILAIKGPKFANYETIHERRELDAISDHKELFDRYELIDCQSVASINRAPTYERPKNQVDVKFNNVSLVTMAFTLATCLEKLSTERLSSPTRDYSEELNLDLEGRRKKVQARKRSQSWLLERFFSGYPDKLVSSVLSKLNKRSLLTRKCPAEQASLYKPKTKMSLKLNQSVLFLLNRYQSSSLIQLAHPINQLYGVELEASNEMASMALLTSLCSLSSFNLDLELRIPPNVVAIDHGNENFKSLCAKANERTREMLSRVKQQDFRTLYKCGSLADCLIVQPCNVKFHSRMAREGAAGTGASANTAIDARGSELSDLINAFAVSNEPPNQQASLTNWLVKSFRFPEDKELSGDQVYETNKIPTEYSARLWKSIDGSINMPSLFKLMESLLSWITVFPGVESHLLKQEFNHLMPDEHLLELLDLMETLELISSQPLNLRRARPRLFGKRQQQWPDASGNEPSSVTVEKTYEPSAHSFVRYCQLLNYRYNIDSEC